jgi:hypothetical protein
LAPLTACGTIDVILPIPFCGDTACTPLTFTLENEVKAGLFAHSYLAVILFGPGLIVVYLDVSTKFHFE